MFAFIKEKAWRRMSGWRNKLLSRAGKENLLKSVVQALSSYAMSVFALLKLFCEELERMMNYFWSGRQLRSGIQWKKNGLTCVGVRLKGVMLSKIT